MTYERQKRYRQKLVFKAKRYEAQEVRRRENLLRRPPLRDLPHRAEVIDWFLNCPSVFAFPGMFEAGPGKVRVYLDAGPGPAAAAMEAFAAVPDGPVSVLPDDISDKDRTLIDAHRLAMRAEVEQVKKLGMWESAT